MEKFKEELLRLYKKARKKNTHKCVYCGAQDECRDHPVPLNYFNDSRHVASMMFNVGGWKTVYSCKDCNLLAGFSLNNSFLDRKAVVLERFEKKWAKNIKSKDWTEKELNELSGMLKISVKQSLEFDKFIKLRHENLLSKRPIL